MACIVSSGALNSTHSLVVSNGKNTWLSEKSNVRSNLKLAIHNLYMEAKHQSSLFLIFDILLP